MKYAAVLVACLASIVVAAPVVNNVNYVFPGTIDQIKTKLDHLSAQDLKDILKDKYGQAFDIAFKNTEGTFGGHITGSFN